MASVHGFFDGSYDYKHMRRMHDLRGPLPIPQVHAGTLLGYLKDQQLAFGGVVASVRQLASTFNDPQATFTLFCPLEVPACVREWDEFSRRRLVLSHTLERPISPNFLKSSGAMYLNTRIPGTRILVENTRTSQPQLNRHSLVVGSYTDTASGFNVVFIDKMLPLGINPLSDIDI